MSHQPPARVLSFGSVNIDHVYHVEDFNKAGETKAAKSYEKFAGGKARFVFAMIGANQSVALAKAGANCFHAGKIGSDGVWVQKIMEEAGVNCELLLVDKKTSTGTAIIQVNENTKQNSILLWAGGNAFLTQSEVEDVIHKPNGIPNWGHDDWIVVQNELTLTPNIINEAHKQGIWILIQKKYSKAKNITLGMKVVYNPAPMSSENIKGAPWDKVNYLLVNETECLELYEHMVQKRNTNDPETLNIEDWESLALELTKLPVFSSGELQGFIVTLGKKGAVVVQPSIDYRVTHIEPATPPFNIEDTTGAGDTFLGYFVAHLIECNNSIDAIKAGAAAAALAITRPGAMASIPTRAEVAKHYTLPSLDFIPTPTSTSKKPIPQ